MYSKIVVGTDGSDTARSTVATAAELAKLHQTTLHVASAYSSSMQADLERLRLGGGSVRAVLDQSLEDLADSGVTVEAHEMIGDPADALCSLAADLDADLIVVGNKGAGSLADKLIGSVPTKVVRNAPCSVLVHHSVD